MKIHVNRIPFEGLRAEATYDPVIMDTDRFDVHLQEPIRISSFITKADNEVVVQAMIRCLAQLSCARCLGLFDSTLQTEAILSYATQPSDVLDITDDIRQEIILAYPMIPVCQESCKGLCPTCGQNLNVASCAHQPR
ncbi:MAG: DUF177 domain-containing protein [Candidatus Omnitrophica bacterium]|nr:DUF177 domain-containing protein [Candidatus Omnitrophota bacterium]